MLDIIKDHRCSSDQQNASSSPEEYISSPWRRLDGLRRRVCEVFDVHLLIGLGKDGEAVASNEYSRIPLTFLEFCGLNRSRSITRKMDQLVGTIINRGGDKDGALGWVVRKSPRWYPWTAKFAQRQDRRRLGVLREIVRANKLLLRDVE